MESKIRFPELYRAKMHEVREERADLLLAVKSKLDKEERAMIDAYLASGGTVRKITTADYWAKVHKDEAKQRRRADFNRFAGSIR